LGKVSHQFDFGRLCRHGFGVDKDIHEAIKWFWKAEEGGLKISRGQLLDIFRDEKTLSEMEQDTDILDQYRIQVALDNRV
jgi:TPR repeat protein